MKSPRGSRNKEKIQILWANVLVLVLLMGLAHHITTFWVHSGERGVILIILRSVNICHMVRPHKGVGQERLHNSKEGINETCLGAIDQSRIKPPMLTGFLYLYI